MPNRQHQLLQLLIKMVQVQDLQKDLWTELCIDRVGNKIVEIWQTTEKTLGLNFLSLRQVFVPDDRISLF